MKPLPHPFRRFFNCAVSLIGLIGLVCLSSLFLAGRIGIEKVSADSGGFPTPRPTATFIPLPTLMPTPTPTFILQPTQASSAQKSLADSSQAESETTGQSANAEQEQPSRRGGASRGESQLRQQKHSQPL